MREIPLECDPTETRVRLGRFATRQPGPVDESKGVDDAFSPERPCVITLSDPELHVSVIGFHGFVKRDCSAPQIVAVVVANRHKQCRQSPSGLDAFSQKLENIQPVEAKRIKRRSERAVKMRTRRRDVDAGRKRSLFLPVEISTLANHRHLRWRSVDFIERHVLPHCRRKCRGRAVEFRVRQRYPKGSEAPHRKPRYRSPGSIMTHRIFCFDKTPEVRNDGGFLVAWSADAGRVDIPATGSARHRNDQRGDRLRFYQVIERILYIAENCPVRLVAAEAMKKIKNRPSTVRSRSVRRINSNVHIVTQRWR